MLIPVRCHTCGKVIGDKWRKYEQYIQSHPDDINGVWKHIGVDRYCCKIKFLGHVELIDKILQYQINFPSIQEKK